jgi:hypothetical protein
MKYKVNEDRPVSVPGMEIGAWVRGMPKYLQAPAVSCAPFPSFDP